MILLISRMTQAEVAAVTTAATAADMRAAVLSQRLAVKFHCEPARALDDGLMT